MKVMVTGATGLVGRQLCSSLLKRGHSIVVVGRQSEHEFRKSFLLPCDYQAWNNLTPDGIDAVFHLAGDSIASAYWTTQKKKKILNSRVDTTKKLVKAFQNQWPSVFIGASAIGYYGHRPSEELNEDSSPGVGFLSEVCTTWENSSKEFEAHSRVVRLRIGIVLDKSGGFLSPQEKLFSLRLGGQVGNGKQWMSWIHIQDLINILIFALENPISGAFNAVAPTPIQNKDWTKQFANTLKVKAFLNPPKFALKLLLGEMSALALDSQKVSSQKIQSKGFQFQFEDLKSALDDLYQKKNA